MNSDGFNFFGFSGFSMLVLHNTKGKQMLLKQNLVDLFKDLKMKLETDDSLGGNKRRVFPA